MATPRATVIRDPPHYLKPLKTTSTPKRLLWLACHGSVTKRRDRQELHFQAAALGKTWWTAKTNTQRDTINTFDNPEVLWRAVVDWCHAGRKVTLFTYDLAEQIRLSHMLTFLPKHGWSLDKIVLERSASWCLMKHGRLSLMCCDLRSWVPVDWDIIVKNVPNDDPPEYPLILGPNTPSERCCAKVKHLRKAVLQIFDFIERENLGQFRPTGSGQSLSAYRRRFNTSRLLVHDQADRLCAERLAMHTGRAEAWRHGPQRHGPYVEYDLQSAYATIGRDCEIPTVARATLRSCSIDKLKRLARQFAVLANVTVTTNIECIPYCLNERTIWPIGTFTTNIWDPEIQLALEHCDSVKVNKVWLYQRAPALRDFCQFVLDGIDKEKRLYPPIPTRMLKHWSRCLVGRLGLRYRAWHRFGPQHPPDVRLVDYVDLIDGTKTEMLLAGNQVMVLGGMQEARESLPQIPGWIMSECRRRLWETMHAFNDAVVYVDTDSIILLSAEHYAEQDPGTFDWANFQWIRKGTYDRLTIHGPRNIEIGYNRRVSGLPLTARQIAPLEFEGEVMRSIRKSMRTGELDRVVSLPRTFHLTAPDLRRQHNSDGSTSPYEILESV